MRRGSLRWGKVHSPPTKRTVLGTLRGQKEFPSVCLATLDAAAAAAILDDVP